MNKLRILVTGAGGPGAVNLCRSLRMMRPTPWILAADASPFYIHLALGHERAVVPRCDDKGAYLEAIHRLVRDHEIDFIMPNNSLEIAVLSDARDTLEAAIFLPDSAVLACADSKWSSYSRWHSQTTPVPATRLITSADDLHRAFTELRDDEDTPVWVRGAGIPGKGIGVASLPCRTAEQAIQWVDYWRGWGGMIASEFLPGRNLTWMGLFRAGELITSQGRERLAYVIPHVSPSGITGAPAISKTIHDPQVNTIAHRAVLELDPDYTGVGFIDMKEDAEGIPRVTELNAGRFGTTHFFYSAAGANFPEMALRLAHGEANNVPKYDLLPPDLVWIRTLDAGPVLTSMDAIKRGEVASLNHDDPWPRVPQRFHEFDAAGTIKWP